MNVRIRFAVAAFALATLGGAFLLNSPARAQGNVHSTVAMTGAISNPVYHDPGTSGSNPLFQNSLRFLLGGATSMVGSSPVANYRVDILISEDDWDGKQFLHKEHIIHRDIAARNFLVQSIDVITTQTGLDISVNRGPRQTVSLDGTYDPKTSRLSTNLTIERQTPKRDFGDRVSVHTFDENGTAHNAVSIPFQEF